jgi:hypothetical protein
MPTITPLKRLRQEDHEFKASLDYIGRPSLQKIPKKCYFGKMHFFKHV